MKLRLLRLSAILLVLALAGCSSATEVEPTKRVVVCTVLPLSTVVMITGRQYLTKASTGDKTTSGCQYAGDAGPNAFLILGIQLWYGGGHAGFTEDLGGLVGTRHIVHGFGTKAVFQDGSLVALFGTDVFSIGQQNPPGTRALPLAVLEKVITSIQASR
jgi:hypothetical protein